MLPLSDPVSHDAREMCKCFWYGNPRQHRPVWLYVEPLNWISRPPPLTASYGGCPLSSARNLPIYRNGNKHSVLISSQIFLASARHCEKSEPCGGTSISRDLVALASPSGYWPK